MARPLRCEYPGAYYHVTARGNDRTLIFRGRADYEAFLAAFELVIERYRWVCHAYCLMGNHYHLLLQTREANLAVGMRQLNGVYAQGFNRRHGRVGHVFEGRYAAILVETERYLLSLARYILRNPSTAGLCTQPGEWLWSSYRALLGQAPCPPLLECSLLLGGSGEQVKAQRAALARFIEDGEGPAPWTELKGTFLGSDRFARAMGRRATSNEIPRRQRDPVRPELRALLRTGSGAEIARAHREHGYRLNEIATVLGIHYATAGRRLRAWEEGRPMLQRKT